MNKIEKIVFPFVILVVFVGMLLAHFNNHFYMNVYTVEDGFTEWMTVLAFLIAASICIKRVIYLRKTKPLLFLAATSFLALGFIFGAGEEISWGQRIFNVQSGEFFAKSNAQGETNLHNLVVNGVKMNKLIFGKILGIFLALYFLVLPVVYREVKAVKNLIDKLAIPIPSGIHIISMLIIFLLAEISMSPKKGELIEFGGSFVFLLLVYNPLNVHIYSSE